MIKQKNMIPLYQTFDSLFPIGSYAFSGGMETYTQKGLVHDRESLTNFLRAQLYILPYGDLGLATKAAQGGDYILLDNMCAAMKQPYEIRLTSERLGSRLLKTLDRLAEYPSLKEFSAAISAGKCAGHYPIAVGLMVRDLEIEIGRAMEMYAYNLLSVMANHAVKLVPLGQKYAQPALYDAMEGIPEAVRKAISVSVKELGVSGCGFDLRAMQHETLHGRLYSS